MITHVLFCDLLLTLAEKFVVHVSLGLSYDCFFFINFILKKFIHFSALGYLSFALCVRSLKSWLKLIGAS